MISKDCQNKNCRKTYLVENEIEDDGYCSFSCFNVAFENPEISEEFVIDLKTLV